MRDARLIFLAYDVASRRHPGDGPAARLRLWQEPLYGRGRRWNAASPISALSGTRSGAESARTNRVLPRLVLRRRGSGSIDCGER
jgi:hypothetical protein